MYFYKCHICPWEGSFSEEKLTCPSCQTELKGKKLISHSYLLVDREKNKQVGNIELIQLEDTLFKDLAFPEILNIEGTIGYYEFHSY